MNRGARVPICSSASWGCRALSRVAKPIITSSTASEMSSASFADRPGALCAKSAEKTPYALPDGRENGIANGLKVSSSVSRNPHQGAPF